MLSRHQLRHRSQRALRGHLFALGLVLVVLSACDRGQKTQKQAEKQPPVQEHAAPAPPTAPPTLWYEGTWHSTVAINKQVSTLSLVVDKAGLASGELTNSSGQSRVSGLKDEDDILRLQLSGEQYYGTLIGRREGEQFVGQLTVSGEGTMDLDLKPPRFGITTDLKLERAAAH